MEITQVQALLTGELRHEDVQALNEVREEQNLERIEAIGKSIAKLRDEAVAARKNSGIETVWRKCEENYLGIDDANRNEFEGQSWAKPMTMEGGLTSNTYADDTPHSTLFVKLTSRYVDASAARVAETLLPVDDKPFSYSSTPIPEMDEALEDGSPVATLPNGMPLPNPENPQMPLTVADVAQKQLDKANEAAKKAEKRVWDWMCESGYAGEMRKCIHDAARIGVAVMKGPVPTARKERKAEKTEEGYVLTFQQKVKPGSFWVDPWNIYPDPACGEDIQNGSYIWEHDNNSKKQLLDYIGQDGYIESQIRKVIKEGPGKRNSLGGSYRQDENQSKYMFDVWHFTGMISREDLEDLGAVGSEDLIEEGVDEVSALLTIVNDSVIRAVLNPLDSGELPYDAMAWKRRDGHWAGCGVAEDLFTPQAMINAATRKMLDNAGLAAGVQIVVDRGAIYPEDGSWVITPNKVWSKAEDSTVQDVRQAFNVFTIPSMQGELSNIIQYALRLAEESAGLPLIAQGQAGPTQPDTATAASLQNNNANTLMRRVAKSYDDQLSTPHIKRYYDWLMMDPEVPQEEKGDWTVVVHGSSALVERSIQDQTIQQLGNMAVPGNPFRLSPEKWIAEMLRSKFIDPSRVQYSDEEWEKIQQQMQQQPQQPMPQIEVAKIRAQTDMQKTQMQIQADAQKTQAELAMEREIAQLENATMQTRIKVDTDRDTAYVQSEMQRDQAEYSARMQELQMKLQLAQLDYASRHQMQLDDVKAKLAIESAKLSTTKELAMMNSSAAMMPKPPVEPAGRAAPGKSYQQ